MPQAPGTKLHVKLGEGEMVWVRYEQIEDIRTTFHDVTINLETHTDTHTKLESNS